jgi:hypothetical protein
MYSPAALSGQGISTEFLINRPHVSPARMMETTGFETKP